MTLVLVTRPDGAEDPLAGALAVAGFGVVAVPTVGTEPVGDGTIERALAELTPGDWVVVTSAVGARAVVAALAALATGAAADLAPMLRWAAVGGATAAPLVAAGITVTLALDRGDGADLARGIVELGDVADRRVLLARSRLADSRPVAILSEAGAHVLDVTAYRTVVGPAASGAPLNRVLGDPDLTAAVFASGSAARGAVALADEDGRRRLGELALVTIGPRTSDVVRSLGLTVAYEASRPNVDALVAGVRRVLAARASADQ